MEYELYADVWFLTNFAMDSISLLIAGRIMKQHIRLGRILLASLAGTGGSMCLFFVLDHYAWYQAGVHFLVNPLMVWICYRSREKKNFFGQWILTYFSVILLGGILEWSVSCLGGNRHFLPCLLGGAGFLLLTEKLAGSFRRQKDTVYDLLLITREGKVKAKGFFDTGNLLMDPVAGRPVHIVKKEILKEQIEKGQFLPRLIPFHSLGKEHGLLEAVTIEGMYILREEHPLYLDKPVMGLAEEELFQDGGCDVILNAKSMEH